ncbi:hypothetical protein ACRAWF_14370 [Streptomyces sp. L7]
MTYGHTGLVPDRTDRTNSGDVNKHGNLPPETLSFVGRGAELARLRAALDPDTGPARPVTVVGVGGVGKTRLALARGGGVQDACPDGVWLTELSPLRTSGLVDLAVMESLRLADQSTRPVIDVITEWAHGKKAVADPRLLRTRPRRLRQVHRRAALPPARPARPAHQQGTARTARRGGPPPRTTPGGRPTRCRRGRRCRRSPVRRARRGRRTPLRDDDPAARATAVAVCRRLDGILASNSPPPASPSSPSTNSTSAWANACPHSRPLPDPSAQSPSGTPAPSSPLDLLVFRPRRTPAPPPDPAHRHRLEP